MHLQTINMLLVRKLHDVAENRPFAASGHMVQNPPCWRASLLLFPHWDIQNKENSNLTG